MKEATPSRRIASVDALRGAIMILMALDHVRDYTNSAAMAFSPTDLTRTTVILFFTRWITHFCAPVFAFTAGIGAFLWLRHGRSRPQLSRFLISRGLWLMLVELTILRLIFFFQWQIRGGFFILTVLWMLGLSMIVLAALIYLPERILVVLSILIIAGHNLFDAVSPAKLGKAAFLWDILHQQAVLTFHSLTFLVAYPLVPWCGVMAAGYCTGRVFLWEAQRRRIFLMRCGVALSAAFVLLRAWDHYGDPSRWTTQHSVMFTILSFLNTTKYPPSLAFLLMTLGPSLVALALLERFEFSGANPLIVFGRVPFFFFLFHLAVAHVLAVALEALRFGWHTFVLIPPPSLGGSRELFPPDFGFSLPVVYLAWFAVVAISYPVCRWYADLKQRRPEWRWLSYL